MTLHQRIKHLRSQSGLSQEQVAAALGISRQAVAKWESGASAPSTENLFRLAELFGTTVDLLLPEPDTAPASPPPPSAPPQRPLLQRRIRDVLVVLLGYCLIYLAYRLFCLPLENRTVLSWLLDQDYRQLPYLYGWLLSSHHFQAAVLLSLIAAALGASRFSFTLLGGTLLGLLLGERFGQNPAGAITGQTHFGWAIWCLMFLLSIWMGARLQRFPDQDFALATPRMRRWCAIYLAVVLGILLLVRLSIPTYSGS